MATQRATQPRKPAARLSVTKVFEVAAKHQLPYHQGKCARDHGHNWRIEVTASGPVKSGKAADAGMVLDFGDLKALVEPLLAELDHYSMNDRDRIAQGARPLYIGTDYRDPLSPLTATVDQPNTLLSGPSNPTAENLCIWLLASLPAFIVRVRVWETTTSYAEAERG